MFATLTGTRLSCMASEQQHSYALCLRSFARIENMYLYETHLPVQSTEVSQRFYLDVVGLEFAYRDPTRDAVFLWIGSNRRSMLGLWGPSTTRGSDFHSPDESRIDLGTLPLLPGDLTPVWELVKDKISYSKKIVSFEGQQEGSPT